MIDRFKSRHIAFAAILAMAFTMPAFAQQQPDLVLRVDIANGSTTGDGETWGTAIKYLQDALALADAWHSQTGQEHDLIEIWVASGGFDGNGRPIAYLPTQSALAPPDESCYIVDFYCARCCRFRLRDNVTIYGGFSGDGWETEVAHRDWEANPTYLSGDLDGDDEWELIPDVVDDEVVDIEMDFVNYDDNSSVIVSARHVNTTAILDGFIIQGANGLAECYPGGPLPPCMLQWGGAVWIQNATPALRNCTIQRNRHLFEVHAQSAAGIYIDNENLNASPEDRIRIINCTIKHNSSVRGAGAVLARVPGIVDFIFCTFEWNLIEETAGYAPVMVYGDESYVTFVNCTISDNYVYDGTTLGFSYGSAGLGIGSSAGTIEARLWNCLISRNRTTAAVEVGGIKVNGSSIVEIINCTIANNYTGHNAGTGGIRLGELQAVVSIKNSIIWHNTPYETDDPPFSTLEIRYSNVQGGWTGTGGNNINSDPIFDEDFTLMYGSPSKDVGDNDSLPCNEYPEELGTGGLVATECEPIEELIPRDLQGNFRVIGCLGIVDQGAFEAEEDEPCYDLNGDGHVNVSDLLILFAAWGACADVCDCPADFNGDGAVNVSDMLILFSKWGEFDCATRVGISATIPETVDDCLATYSLGSQELIDCLYWIDNKHLYEE